MKNGVTYPIDTYNRTHTTSRHKTGGSNTTTTRNEGVVHLSASDNSPVSNHSPESDDTAQAGNLNLNCINLDPDELIIEGLFLSSAVHDGI